MKKFLVAILALITFVSFTMDSAAYARRFTANKPPVTTPVKNIELKNVEYSSSSNQDSIQIYVDGLKDYEVSRLSDPDRIVIDFPDAKAPEIQKQIDVNGKFVKSVRYAQYNDSTARVVVELAEESQYYIEKKSGKLVLHFTKPLIENIIYYIDEGKGNLVINGVKLYDDNGELQKLFTESLDQSGKKYTITFPSNQGELKNKIVRVNDNFINMVRVYNNNITGKTSITLYAKDKLSYEVNPNNEANGAVISFKKESGSDDGGDPGNNNGEPSPELDVKYTSLKGNDVITIMSDRYKGYNITRLTDPYRIVIDIPNVSAPSSQRTINVGSSRLSAVRYAKYDKNTARIVLDTKGMVQYTVEEKDGQLVLNVENPTYKNLVYHNNADRIYFSLNGAVLTEGGQDLKKYYTGKYDSSGSKYTMTFRSSLANIGEGIIKINDSYLESVEITTDAKSKNTSITFNAKGKFVYEVMTRPAVNNTAITILKPYSKQDKLVVIDAGHGDVEPGAVYANVKEKNLNLDIALRLNSLLKSKGVKTYMLREDDSYVGLYERAYIANSLNATLFLSIHNNAFNSKERGTETLYFPGRANSAGFSSKRFAQLIQNELVGTLKTHDRKLKERPGLVVLKATKMPAALAEVAFITNDADRKNLLDEKFRQKSAEALCEAIIKALSEN